MAIPSSPHSPRQAAVRSGRKARVVAGNSVSVLMVRKIKPGCESRFWSLESEIEAAVSRCAGFLGVSHLPTAGGSNEYMTVLQFDSVANLSRWQDSSDRRKLLEQADALVQGDVRRRSVSGLEGLFDAAPLPQPRRYKMTLLLIVVILTMLLLLRPLVALALGDIAPTLQMAATVVVQVVLMTYWVMPGLTRLLRGWLYRP